MRRTTFALVTTIFLGASGAAAKDDVALTTQLDMTLCKGITFEQADTRLNEI